MGCIIVNNVNGFQDNIEATSLNLCLILEIYMPLMTHEKIMNWILIYMYFLASDGCHN